MFFYLQAFCLYILFIALKNKNLYWLQSLTPKRSTGEKSILPSASNNTFTIDSVKYQLNSKDYTKFNKQDGGKALEIINKFSNWIDVKEWSTKEITLFKSFL